MLQHLGFKLVVCQHNPSSTYYCQLIIDINCPTLLQYTTSVLISIPCRLYHAALEQQYVAESFLTSQRQQSSKGSLKTTPLQNVQAPSLSPESSATTNHAVSDISASSSSSTSSNTSASNGGLSGRGRRRKRSPSSNIASSSSSDTQSKLRSSSRLYKKHSEWYAT